MGVQGRGADPLWGSRSVPQVMLPKVNMDGAVIRLFLVVPSGGNAGISDTD